MRQLNPMNRQEGKGMYEASERDFRVVMVADSMSQVYEKGIQEMSSIGVYVCGLDDVLNAIK
jgi:hypothetical protein